MKITNYINRVKIKSKDESIIYLSDYITHDPREDVNTIIDIEFDDSGSLTRNLKFIIDVSVDNLTIEFTAFSVELQIIEPISNNLTLKGQLNLSIDSHLQYPFKNCTNYSFNTNYAFLPNADIHSFKNEHYMIDTTVIVNSVVEKKPIIREMNTHDFIQIGKYGDAMKTLKYTEIHDVWNELNEFFN